MHVFLCVCVHVRFHVCVSGRLTRQIQRVCSNKVGMVGNAVGTPNSTEYQKGWSTYVKCAQIKY